MIDEFYIGYDSTMPARIARRVRGVAIVLLLAAAAIPLLLIAVQGCFSSGRFEYGTTRTFEGRLVEFPYPALDVSAASAALPSKENVSDGSCPRRNACALADGEAS